MATRPIIKIRSNERIDLCGKTGSGKTYAAKYLLSRFDRLVILDVKGELDGWNTVPWDREAKRLLRNGEPVRARVLVPVGRSPEETWEDVFATILESGNCHLYIDEMYGVTPPGKSPSDLLWAIFTRGRSMGIGTTTATQRPTWVPLISISEAEHFFCFRLTMSEDRKRMASFMGPEVVNVIRAEHGVYYTHVTWSNPIYRNRLPLGPEPRKGGNNANT